MRNVYDVLNERGYIEESTHEDELRKILEDESLSFYVGFDATADSLTLGHFIQIMVMKHMIKAGHRPIVLLGGGTTMIGDPSGRDEMRNIMTREFIDENVKSFKEQFSRFIDFEKDAIFVNNADWLLELNYLEFMRDIGTHFTVSRMIGFDAYKNRLEDGLTFFEFGYLPLQSYDFLHLFREYNCRLQIGGSDQWANIIGGFDLVRRVEGEKVYAMTMKLLTTASGEKMGKTGQGTIWLDRNRTSPFELFQYMRNIDDRDVSKFLKTLTFVSLEEIEELSKLEGAEINKAKERLAYEVVKLIHSEEDAKAALDSSKSLFAGKDIHVDMPSSQIDKEIFKEGIGLLNLLRELGLTKTNGEGRRLVEQGGIYLNEEQVKDPNYLVEDNDFEKEELVIRRGRNRYHKVIKQ